MHNGSDSRFCSPTSTVPANLTEGGPPRTSRFLHLPPLVIDLEDPEMRSDPWVRRLLRSRGL